MNRRTALKTAIGGMLAALWPWKAGPAAGESIATEQPPLLEILFTENDGPVTFTAPAGYVFLATGSQVYVTSRKIDGSLNLAMVQDQVCGRIKVWTGDKSCDWSDPKNWKPQ